mmetsp:Transcript_41772/g.133284  ORF Transcript_41772/g.133284 Transcript_41772/m.133284 type:complete len:137 (+) Transcript_41772:3-413(+)
MSPHSLPERAYEPERVQKHRPAGSRQAGPHHPLAMSSVGRALAMPFLVGFLFGPCLACVVPVAHLHHFVILYFTAIGGTYMVGQGPIHHDGNIVVFLFYFLLGMGIACMPILLYRRANEREPLREQRALLSKMDAV